MDAFRRLNKKPEISGKKMETITHYVRDNDSLKDLADIYGSKVKWLKEYNPSVKSDRDLVEDMKLIIPVLPFENADSKSATEKKNSKKKNGDNRTLRT